MILDPLRIFIAIMFTLFTVILVSLSVAAAMVGDWFALGGGAVGTVCTIALGVELLRS
jgi:hypothetical protein